MNVKEWLGKDNQLGIDIWERKYCYNNESFDQWLDRVSGGNKDIKELIEQKKFLFAGRILANRGLHKNGKKITYSNCYVLKRPEDSIESIFDCAKELARTFSYGGGCGIDISNLAPKGALVNNAAKETSGSVSFMDLYSLTTELIGQNGRRGALMISLDCHHPDIEDFIEIKSDLDKVTKANISIRVTDDFMDAVVNDKDFKLSFTRDETGETTEKIVKASEIFDKMCEMNWDYAEPGILYWDRIENYNLLSEDEEFKYAGVNPCAEEPLPEGGSCLLGSINLAEFVIDPFTNNAKFDFDSFEDTVRKAVIALNEVLDEGLPLHPLNIQQETVRDWRQIGLGIMGLADMLIKMKIVYGSEDSILLCDGIGQCLAKTAIIESSKLTDKYNSYPKFKREKVAISPFFKKHVSLHKDFGLRNSQLLTIAPTGTLSTMLGISGGIEPIFANYYTRKTESLHGEDKYYKIFTPIAWEYLESHGYGEDESKLPEYFITSQEIPYRNRIDMQAVWQSHIDASISSTVNLPNSATIEDVKDLYIYAWEKGLKGITVFRDGCKRMGILTTDDQSVDEDIKDENSIQKCNLSSLPRGIVLEADDDAVGKKRKLITGCGSLHCSAFFDPVTGDLLETYLSKGSSGGCANFMVGLSRMISLAARGGVPIESIIDQLNSCGVCPSYAVRRAIKQDTSKGSCCPIAVGNALKEMYDEMQSELCSNELSDDIVYEYEYKTEKAINAAGNVLQVFTTIVPKCPQCGEPLVFEGGCNICKACGYSKCD